ALNVGQTLTDTFVALSIDGTAKTVTITIHGTNDAAVITGVKIGGATARGSIRNAVAGTPIATGALVSTDFDNLDTLQPRTIAAVTANSYDTYTLAANGLWPYTLDNSNSALEALNVGHTLTDTFVALSADGTAKTVTITIHGTNDAAVITGV